MPYDGPLARFAATAAFLLAATAAARPVWAQTGAPSPAPVPEFRPSDVRPKHDDKKLAAVGIRVFESKRLKLYTDIDPEQAAPLPRLLDAAYDAFVEYFGPLPPNRERSEFQVTGYVMSDKELFREAGLLPADLPGFLNGRHRGAEFWMNQQKHDYYRRHLLIHEATHCYMTILGGPLPPLWYVEGMAELFGTHHLEKDGTVRFRVFPQDELDYPGLGRIAIIRKEMAEGRGLSFDAVERLSGNQFLKNEAYAWSWGLCALLDGHPRWREPFRALGRNFSYREFDRVYRAAFEPDLQMLRTEWSLYADGIQEGYDRERAAVAFVAAKPLADGASADVEVAAARGWQSTGLTLEAGVDYEVTATGRITLAKEPKPWISEPQGVSIRYFEGRPLGQLLAWIEPHGAPATRAAEEPEDVPLRRRLEVIPLGAKRRFRADRSGTLFLRTNDAFAELADNGGNFAVRVVRGP